MRRSAPNRKHLARGADAGHPRVVNPGMLPVILAVDAALSAACIAGIVKLARRYKARSTFGKVVSVFGMGMLSLLWVAGLAFVQCTATFHLG
jgi:hypothetical protein